jgi:hypothetical protein
MRDVRVRAPLLALAVVLLGCGSSSTLPGALGGAAGSTPTSTPLAGTSAFRFNPPGAQDASGLHVQVLGESGSVDLGTGISEPSVGIDCGQWLVLASDRLTYSATEARDIGTFIQAYGPQEFGRPGRYQDPGSLPQPPPTLALVPGGDECAAEFEVTNTGGSTLQLADLGLRLDAAPAANALTYRLIDACPYLFPDPQQRMGTCGPGAGAGAACAYVTQITIRLGASGTKFGAPIRGFDPGLPGRPPCSNLLTLSAHQTIAIMATIAPPGSTGTALVYEVTPYITLVGSAGPQDVLFPRLSSTLVFTSPSQFACYQPNGNAFAPLPPGTPLLTYGVACI